MVFRSEEEERIIFAEEKQTGMSRIQYEEATPTVLLRGSSESLSAE
jgi:hypothetical protein